MHTLDIEIDRQEINFKYKLDIYKYWMSREAKENFTYRRPEMIFHFSFIGLNLAYVMWRVAAIAIEHP